MGLGVTRYQQQANTGERTTSNKISKWSPSSMHIVAGPSSCFIESGFIRGECEFRLSI